ARRPLPVGRRAGMLERNAAIGEILSKSTPRGEVQLVGLLELLQIPFEARSLGQQPEDAALVEHADVVLPYHVIDGRQPFTVAHQDGRQTRKAVSHDGPSGIGMATANPAR